jgi:succinyl-CoA synthetase beta subunit
MTGPFASFSRTSSLLADYTMPMPPAQLVQTQEEAVQFFNQSRKPVAIKVISRQESHKSDRGLLALGLKTEQSIQQQAASLLEKSGNLSIEGLLVQQMAPAGVECLVGLVNDPTFGMMLAFGAGGVLVELLDKVTLRLAPIDEAEALWLIRRHPINRLLQGYRNTPPADTPALAKVLADLSRLGADHQDEIDSLDINPVIASPEGAWAVDFRMKLKDGAP